MPQIDDSPAQVRAGFRAGLPVAVAIGLLGASFGAVAHEADLSAALAIAMSALVFSGSAQFTAVAIVAAGGGVGPAILGAALMNARYLPMGVAIAPWLPGGRLRGAVQGLAMADASWALAARRDGSFDRHLMFGSSLAQWLAWVGGTALGALAGGALRDPDALGIDASYPAFFVAILLLEDHSRRSWATAVAGAGIALALVPVAPAGIPVLAASAAAAIALLPGPDVEAGPEADRA